MIVDPKRLEEAIVYLNKEAFHNSERYIAASDVVKEPCKLCEAAYIVGEAAKEWLKLISKKEPRRCGCKHFYGEVWKGKIVNCGRDSCGDW